VATPDHRRGISHIAGADDTAIIADGGSLMIR
jgi:hypothetical protein